MMRILLLLLLGYLLYQLFTPSKIKKKIFNQKKDKNKPQIEAHPMVQCMACETFIPKNESLDFKGQSFCDKKCQEGYKN